MRLLKATIVAVLSLFAVSAVTVPASMAQGGAAKAVDAKPAAAKTAKAKKAPAKAKKKAAKPAAKKAKPAKKAAACKGQFMYKDKKSGKCMDSRNKKG